MLTVQTNKKEKQKLHVIFLVPSSMSRCKFKDEGKSKFHPVAAFKAQKENRRVTSTLSLNSTQD
jgi:hypothetical protein